MSTRMSIEPRLESAYFAKCTDILILDVERDFQVDQFVGDAEMRK